MIPLVLTDSGVENLNSEVDSLVDAGLIERIIAQIDIEFSNSMVEAFFRSIKHRWLFLISLSTFPVALAAIQKYMDDYTHRIPLDALSGGTPFEVWSGNWTDDAKAKLSSAGFAARTNRMVTNKSLSCGVCPV